MSRISRFSRVSHSFVTVKNTINVIAKYYLIERNSTVLHTHAVNLDCQ